MTVEEKKIFTNEFWLHEFCSNVNRKCNRKTSKIICLRKTVQCLFAQTPLFVARISVKILAATLQLLCVDDNFGHKYTYRFILFDRVERQVF